MGGTVHNTAATAAQIPLSPLQSNDSPNTNQVQQSIAPPSQPQGPPFRGQAPQNITSVHQTVTPSMAAPMNAARPPYNPQIAAPPNYHPAGLAARATHPRWMRPPFIAPGATAPANTQSSALIAQLTQPPSSLGLNVAAFGQRLDGRRGEIYNTSYFLCKNYLKLNKESEIFLRDYKNYISRTRTVFRDLARFRE